MRTVEPVLPDTALTVLPRYWTRPAAATDARYMDPEQHAQLVLACTLPYSCTFLDEDTPLCVWGALSVSETDGVLWLFRQSAAAMEAHALPIARAMYRCWTQWTLCPSWYETLVCRATMGDQAIDRLLRWLGFRPTGFLTDSPHGYMLAEYRWMKGQLYVYGS